MKSCFPWSDNMWCVKNQMLMLLVAKLGIFRIQQYLLKSKSNAMHFKR